MNDKPTPQSTGQPVDTGDTYQSQKPKVSWPVWKTVVLSLIVIVAIGLTTNSIVYNNTHQTSTLIPHSPPTYTGSAPLSVASINDAYDSNNDFVLVITPCSSASLNSSITALAVQAADKIRSTDRIFVGVFILPQDNTLTYPTVKLRLFTAAASAFPVTLKSNITADVIYSQYLDRKFLRGG
jgi:hypothetical protein